MSRVPQKPMVKANKNLKMPKKGAKSNFSIAANLLLSLFFRTCIHIPFLVGLTGARVRSRNIPAPAHTNIITSKGEAVYSMA